MRNFCAIRGGPIPGFQLGDLKSTQGGSFWTRRRSPGPKGPGLHLSIPGLQLSIRDQKQPPKRKEHAPVRLRLEMLRQLGAVRLQKCRPARVVCQSIEKRAEPGDLIPRDDGVTRGEDVE